MKINVANAMAKARNAMTDGAFQQVGSALAEAKHIVREEAQRKTSEEMQAIIGKLRSFAPLAAEEAALIKAWIVGDAESYIKMENNFQDWLAEYARLEQSLAGYEQKDCSAAELSQLHGVLEDAIRITYDIANFLEKQDRVKKFESALAAGLGQDGGFFLANLLANKLQSQED